MSCKYILKWIIELVFCKIYTQHFVCKCSYFIITTLFSRKEVKWVSVCTITATFSPELHWSIHANLISSLANVLSISDCVFVFLITLQKKIVIPAASPAKGSILDPRFKTYEAPFWPEIAAARVLCRANILEIRFNINPALSEVLKVQQVANNVQPSVANK